MKENDPNEPWSQQTIVRFLYVALFTLIYAVAELVVAAVVLLQFGFKLATGSTNDKLFELGISLTRFIYQVLQFATFQSDQKPFPFADWPQPNATAEQHTAPPGAGESPRPEANRPDGNP